MAEGKKDETWRGGVRIDAAKKKRSGACREKEKQRSQKRSVSSQREGQESKDLKTGVTRPQLESNGGSTGMCCAPTDLIMGYRVQRGRMLPGREEN